jgi:RimJ/RimL family protein N-acetyltransferase
MADQSLSVRFAANAYEASRILRIPQVFLGSSDDFSGPIQDVNLQTAIDRGADIVEVVLDDKVVGFFMLLPVTGITKEIHVGFEPGFERHSHRAVGLMVELIFNRTQCRKLIAMIASNNRRACMLAAHSGFRREGLIKSAVLIDGEVHDMVLYGRAKG